MFGVRGDGGNFARVATGALAIIDSARQWQLVYGSVPLRVRIVTRGTRHAAVAVTVAGQVTLLIRECARAPVGGEWRFAQL